MSHVLVRIQRTGKDPHPTGKWILYDESSYQFSDMNEAKAFLRKEYFSCKKRKPCYMDTQSRGTVQCGWIYCFKVEENGKTHYEQHWVTLYEEDRRVIAVR